jgi:hypothetical protein
VVALVAIAAVIASLLGASAANAYLGSAVNIELSTNTAPPGGSLNVTGQGFQPNSDVSLTLHSTPVSLGTAHTNGAGSFSQGVTIPASTTSGSHTITAVDAAGDTASASLTVTGSSGSSTPPSTGLAGTGVAVIGIGALGVVLLIGGGLMLLAGRRRKSMHTV